MRQHGVFSVLPGIVYFGHAPHRLAGVMVLNKKINMKTWIAAIAIPLLAGAAAACLAREGFGIYALLYKPLFSPPGWVFAPVWTAVYVLMGAASCLVYGSQASPPRKRRALRLYAVQLFLNFLWPVLFFRMGAYFGAFLLLLLLWVLVLICRLLFQYISKTAGMLMTVYLIWLSFAGYLNLGVIILN